MQNKPNFPSAKMNLNPYCITAYVNLRLRGPRTIKPNLNPTPNSTHPTIKMQNKPNFQNDKINLTTYGSRDYEILHLRQPRKSKPNQPQFRTNTRCTRIKTSALLTIDLSRLQYTPMNDSTKKLIDLDKKYLWHPFTQMALWLESEQVVIDSAEGFHLIDTRGNRYIDGVSSLWCNVHQRPRPQGYANRQRHKSPTGKGLPQHTARTGPDKVD